MTDIRTIGVFAPASYVEAGDIDKGRRVLEAMGYHVIIHDQAYDRLGRTQLAGPPANRAQALHDLLQDMSIDAIMAAGGGNDTAEMLDHIDFDLAGQHPKPVIGFSDVTALLCALFNHAGIKGVHAPVLKLLGGKQNTQENREALTYVLNGHSTSYPLDDAEPVISGTAQGQLIGGNICLIDALYGTPYLPDLNGKILLIEDCAFELNYFNRQLTSWRQRGMFDQIHGLVIGDFSDTKDSGRPLGFDVDEIIERHMADMDIPVVRGAPFGHDTRNIAWPFGGHARLEAGREQCTMTFTPL